LGRSTGSTLTGIPASSLNDSGSLIQVGTSVSATAIQAALKASAVKTTTVPVGRAANGTDVG
jgi:hypothetical protein